MKNKFFKKNHPQTKFLCYNGTMLKTKTKVKIGFVSILSVAAGVQASTIVAQQALAQDTTFQVNVVESLSVSVTTDSQYSSGAINTLLRNPVTLDVTSNNSNGFTASMYSTNSSADGSASITEGTSAAHTILNTDLTNGTNGYISTLSKESPKSDFPDNSWGYNLQYSTTDGSASPTGDTASGNDSSFYEAMTDSTSSPIHVMERDSAASGTQTIWFGAKANATKASGDYENTVVLSVVSGVTDSSTNPATPDNPVYPSTDTTADDRAATYTGNTGTGATQGVGNSGYTGTTVYTTTSGGGAGDTTSTTTTEVSGGDTTASYPLGVTETTSSSINSGAPLATGLAVTAAVAAASGLVFFILAKRKKDDEDEDEESAQ